MKQFILKVIKTSTILTISFLLIQIVLFCLFYAVLLIPNLFFLNTILILFCLFSGMVLLITSKKKSIESRNISIVYVVLIVILILGVSIFLILQMLFYQTVHMNHTSSPNERNMIAIETHDYHSHFTLVFYEKVFYGFRSAKPISDPIEVSSDQYTLSWENENTIKITDYDDSDEVVFHTVIIK